MDDKKALMITKLILVVIGSVSIFLTKGEWIFNPNPLVYVSVGIVMVFVVIYVNYYYMEKRKNYDLKDEDYYV